MLLKAKPVEPANDMSSWFAAMHKDIKLRDEGQKGGNLPTSVDQQPNRWRPSKHLIFIEKTETRKNLKFEVFRQYDLPCNIRRLLVSDL